MAKGKRICDKCGYNFATPRKLRDHLERKFKCKPITQITIPQGVPPPILHIRGRDRRREIAKRNKSPKPISQEAGPGPATQAYREEITSQNEVQEVKYAPENHFRSIYEIEDGIIEKEPPSKAIEFLERRPDPNRQHQNLNSMTIWEGIVPSTKNPAYIFNKRQDNSIKYADAPYMPQFMDSS